MEDTDEIRAEDVMPPAHEPGPQATPPPGGQKPLVTNETMAAFLTRLKDAITDPRHDEELANAALELVKWEDVSGEAGGMLANLSPEVRFWGPLILMTGVWVARAWLGRKRSSNKTQTQTEIYTLAPCPNCRGPAEPTRHEGDFLYWQCRFCKHEFQMLTYEGWQKQQKHQPGKEQA